MRLNRRLFIWSALPAGVARAAWKCGDPDQNGVSVCQVGIDKSLVDVVLRDVPAQQQSYWCWAACIEMVLKGYGVSVTQEQIVRHVFGGKYNLPINLLQFKRIEGLVRSGGGCGKITVSLDVSRTIAIKQLAEGRPVIIGYRLPGKSVGHAVVLTGATVYRHPWDKAMMLAPILTVRDPMRPGEPLELGKEEWQGIDKTVSIRVDSC